MKRCKRLASFILAATMIFALSVTAFAAGPEANGKITIGNPTKGQNYTIYCMFDLESYNNESGAYSYKVNEK